MENSKQQKVKHFWCDTCSYYWQTSNYCINTKDDLAYSNCPKCNSSCVQKPHYFANLPIMAQNATGPKTLKGKERSSLNSYKHGHFAKKARMLAPAKYNKYSECKNCEYASKCSCGELKHCPVRLEPMLRVLQAVKDGDSDALSSMAAINYAKTNYVLAEAYNELVEKGLLLHSVKVNRSGSPIVIDKDKDNNPIYIDEYTLNPAAKLIDVLTRNLGHDGDSLQVTPKAQVEKDSMEGKLKRDVVLSDYMATLAGQLANSPILARNASKNQKTSNANSSDALQCVSTKLNKPQIVKSEAPNESPFKR